MPGFQERALEQLLGVEKPVDIIDVLSEIDRVAGQEIDPQQDGQAEWRQALIFD